MFWRGKEIYRRGDELNNVYYLFKGKIMFCNEVNLNLAETFFNGILNKTTAYHIFFNS